MDSSLFDVDRRSGLVTLHHFDETSDETILETRQDAEPLIEWNKAQFNAFDERARWRKEGINKVASIPLTVYWDLHRRGIVQDQKAFRKWLNDADNRVFRTRPGRV